MSRATASKALFEIFIEGTPVSMNRMWRRAKQGHLYLNPAAADWELAVKSQISVAGINVKRVQAAPRPLRVVCEFNRIRGDADNYLKPVLDGLKYGVRIDDREFSPVESHVVQDRSRPQGVRVTVFASQVIAQCLDQQHDCMTLTQMPALIQPGSLRASDLMDVSILEAKLAKYAPGESVRVSPATDYGAIFVMFPQSPLNVDGQEWGAFVSLEQARQLRDLLNGMPELATSAPRGGHEGGHGEACDDR